MSSLELDETQIHFEATESAWFERGPRVSAPPPSIEVIRATLRSSRPPAPPPAPIGDDELDLWLSKSRRR